LGEDYQTLRRKLRGQLRNTTERDVRVKVELLLLGVKLGSVTEACARRGFSRKFYYTWWNRLRRAKFDLYGLKEKSRRPKRSPGQIPGRVEKRIRFFHRKGCGARQIQAYLRREDQVKLSTTTICHVLNGRRKVRKKRKDRLKAHNRRYELPIPGQRFQIDVKYVPEFVGGRRVYNFVAVDECTRWRFARGYYDLHGSSTADFLERLRRACPFPVHGIQTDNGFEFTYRLIPQQESKRMPLHAVQEWCTKNRIHHRCIPPGEKELNGKVERSHRLDEQYFYWRAPTDTLEHFNQKLLAWLGDSIKLCDF
jgi:transposase InsO family protein